MSGKRWEAILFDLDGTLIDTNDLILRSFEHVFETAGIKQWSREDMIPLMGMPLWEQMRRFTGREDVHDLVRIYRKFNLYNHDRYVKPFPDLQEVIMSLHQAGYRLGVVTSKMRYTSELGLSLYKVLHHFESMVTIEDVRNPKPHPEPMRVAMKNMNLMPSQLLMVGDSSADLASARAAGISTVAVEWSLKTKDELEKYQPTFWVKTLKDLEVLCGIK